MRKRTHCRIFVIAVLAIGVLTDVESVVAQVGAAAADKNETTMVVYRIAHQDAQRVMQTLTSVVLPPSSYHAEFGNELIRTAVDRSANSLIIVADEKTHESVKALLKVIDIPQAQTRPEKLGKRDVMIRVVWLMNKESIKNDAPIPPDLVLTVEKISARFGVGQLGTAGQIVVNQQLSEHARFEGRGTASVNGTSEFSIKGDAQIGEGDSANLTVQVSTGPVRIVENGNEKRVFQKPMCDFTSEITVPIGRPVFIGMAPVESNTSLFILQVLDADEVNAGNAEHEPKSIERDSKPRR